MINFISKCGLTGCRINDEKKRKEKKRKEKKRKEKRKTERKECWCLKSGLSLLCRFEQSN